MNAAFTVVQNDMVILELWLKYYRKNFDNLYVMTFGNSHKDRLKALKKKYGFTTKEFGPIQGVKPTNELIKKDQVRLLKRNRFVLYTNCDEIIVPRKGSLKMFMKKRKDKYIPCEGYDVFAVEGEALLRYDKPILAQRKYWVKNVSYNKIILSRVPLNWNSGQHQVINNNNEVDTKESKAIKNTGLLLVHLKYIDPGCTVREYGPYTSTSKLGSLIDEKELMPKYIRKVI